MILDSSVKDGRELDLGIQVKLEETSSLYSQQSFSSIFLTGEISNMGWNLFRILRCEKLIKDQDMTGVIFQTHGLL
jgi:hypothetical protein